MSKLQSILAEQSGQGGNMPSSLQVPGSGKRIPYTEQQLNALSGYVGNAYARGLISDDDVRNITDKSNLVQRVLFLDGPQAQNSGGILETLGDVLSIPLYGSHAYHAHVGEKEQDSLAEKVTSRLNPFEDVPWVSSLRKNVLTNAQELEYMVNPLNPFGIYKGFKGVPALGLKTFADSWQNKRTWSQDLAKAGIFGESDMARFGGGLAADIALDPSTYMTFGIAPAVKVAPSLLFRTSGKLAAEKGSLTLTRFGTKLYRLAAEELAPKFAQEMEGARHLTDGPISARWHQMIADHMVENFESLKTKLLARQQQGLWGKLKLVAGPLTETGKEALAATVAKATRGHVGLSADDMFRETASELFSERGLIDSSEWQTKLANAKVGGKLVKETLDIGRPFRWVFDTFDRGWNVPPDVHEQARLGYYASSQALKHATDRYVEEFKGLTKEERESVSLMVEARGLRGTEAQSIGSFAPITERAERAVQFFEKEMNDILASEKAAGFHTEEAEGYVNHVYSFSPRMRTMALDLIRKNGEIHPQAFNRFSQQRLIASIAEGEDIFGQGSMLKDAYSLLGIRKRASLDLLHRDQLYKYVVEKHGVPAAILHAMSQGPSKGLIRGFFRRAAAGVQGIMDSDQVYKASNGVLQTLGFAEGDLVRAKALMKYFSMPLTKEGRLSEEGMALATKLGLSDEAQLWQIEKAGTSPVVGISGVKKAYSAEASSLPATFRPIHIKAREAVGHFGIPTGAKGMSRQGPDFKVDTFLDMMMDPKHPAWESVFSHAVARGQLNWSNLQSIVGGFHRFTSRYLESQLPGFLPDIDNRLWRAVENYALSTGMKIGKKRKAGWLKKIGKLTDSMKEPMEIRKLEPQLPESFVQLAKDSREAFGLKADTTPFAPAQKVELLDRARQLGFSGKPLKDFVRLLIGKEDIETASEMDCVLDALGHWQARFKMGDKGELWRNGDKVVRVPITFQRSSHLPLPELTSSERAFEAESGRLAKDLPEGVSYMQGEPMMPGTATEEEQILAEAYKASKQGEVEKAQKKLRAHMDSFPPETVDALRAEKKLRELSLDKRAAQQAHRGVVAANPGKTAEAATLKRVSKAKKALAHQNWMMFKKVYDAQYKPLVDAWKKGREVRVPLQAELKNARKELAKTERATLSATVKQPGTIKPGGIEDGKGIKPTYTAGKRVEAARQALRQAQGPEQIQQALSDLEEARAWERERTRLMEGEKRIPKSPLKMDVYVPESIAKYLRDLEQPAVNPAWSSTVKRMVARYDSYVNWTRSNLMLPHGGYWMRNMYSTTAGNYFSTGLKMLDPTGGFSNLRDWLTLTAYTLAHHTNILDEWAVRDSGLRKGIADSIGKRLVEWGDHEIQFATGRSTKVRDFVEDMGIRGVFGGIGGAEILDAKLGTRIGGGGSGFAAGMAAGAVGGAIVGGPVGSVAGATMGAIAGTYLGARQNQFRTLSSLTSKWGVPSVAMDGVTGLLQSNWRPLVEAGDAILETPFRMAHFLVNAKETGSLYEATRRFVAHQNDWSSFSSFERQFMRRIFPLNYSWTKLALTSVIRQMAEHPIRFRNVLESINQWNEGEEEGPDYLKDHLVMLGQVPWGGTRQRVAVTGLGLPLEDVANLLSPLTDDHPLQRAADELLQRGPAGFTTLAQLALNRDAFSGQPITPEIGEHGRFERGEDWTYAPFWLKKVVGYRPATDSQPAYVDPRVAWLLKGVPTSRFMQYSQLMYDKKGQLNTQMLARQLLGVSVYKVDPETNQYFENRRKIDKMAALLDSIGKISRYEEYYQKKGKPSTRVPIR